MASSFCMLNIWHSKRPNRVGSPHLLYNGIFRFRRLLQSYCNYSELSSVISKSCNAPKTLRNSRMQISYRLFTIPRPFANRPQNVTSLFEWNPNFLFFEPSLCWPLPISPIQMSFYKPVPSYNFLRRVRKFAPVSLYDVIDRWRAGAVAFSIFPLQTVRDRLVWTRFQQNCRNNKQ